MDSKASILTAGEGLYCLSGMCDAGRFRTTSRTNCGGGMCSRLVGFQAKGRGRILVDRSAAGSSCSARRFAVKCPDLQLPGHDAHAEGHGLSDGSTRFQPYRKGFRCHGEEEVCDFFVDTN